MKNDVFHRCLYNLTTPENGTERMVFVIRNYAPGWATIDALLENYRDMPDAPGALADCVVREVVEHKKEGRATPVSLEVFVGNDRKLKLDGFEVDGMEYTAEELIENPGLLPGGDVNAFLHHYESRDEWGYSACTH